MKQYVGKPNTLKEVNKAIIFGEIRSHDGISQPEIAARTGISLQTVNKIVKELQSEGTIRCSSAVKETGGRKAKIYKANENNNYIVCVYIQQSKFYCRIANSVENIILSCTYDRSVEKSWTEDLIEVIRKLLAQTSEEKVKIIGVAVPGTVTGDKIFNIPAIPEWEGIDLKSKLQSIFGCKIYIENDIKSAAMCAYNSISHSNMQNLVYISILDNFGSSIIFNQALYNSGRSFAGEIAYLAMDERGQSESKCGCADRLLEEYIANGDKESFIRLTARVLVNITCIVDPDRIVIATPYLLQQDAVKITEYMGKYILEEYIPEIVIENVIAENNLSGIVSICNKRLDRAVHIVKS